MFDIYSITDLLFKYLTHPSVNIVRKFLSSPSTIAEQKLMITVAMCNTAIGLLQNGKRRIETSFAYQLTNLLYNRQPEAFIDCVISGTLAWVYPIPGAPNFYKLLNYLFNDWDAIKKDNYYRQNTHKRYAMNFSFFGKLYEIPILIHDTRHQYKAYFLPNTNNDIDCYKNMNVTLQAMDGEEWYAQQERRAVFYSS